MMSRGTDVLGSFCCLFYLLFGIRTQSREEKMFGWYPKKHETLPRFLHLDILVYVILTHLKSSLLALGLLRLLEPFYFHIVDLHFNYIGTKVDNLTVVDEKYTPLLKDALFVSLAAASVRGGLYVLANGFFQLVTRLNLANTFPRKPSQIPSSDLIMSTIREAPFDLFFFTPISAFVGWPLFARMGAPRPQDPLPSDSNVLLQFIFSYFIFEILFYAGHYMLHKSPYLYKTVHKHHHKYKGTVSFGADQSHPLENLISATIPIVTGPILTQMHPLTFVVWVAWRLQQSYEEHSGVSFVGTAAHSLGLTHSDNAAFHDE
jgi:sterol desaturase/sphingolipid hydroxylase (fatty acid hydroxylase superfamily)